MLPNFYEKSSATENAMTYHNSIRISNRQAVPGCYPDAFCLLGQIPKPQDRHFVLAAHFEKMLLYYPKIKPLLTVMDLLYSKNPLHTNAAIWYDVVD